MRTYRNWLIALCFLLIVVSFPTLVHAQPDPAMDPDAPIDGGIGVLIAAGVGYGLKKMRDNKIKKGIPS